MRFFLLLIIAYLFGAIPSGVWIGKIFKNIDVRNYGSKNSGATNCYRVMGAKLGLLVLLCDVLKGFIPMLIVSKYLENSNSIILFALITILAHTYSCFISFKGGKGVATSLGVFLFLAPYAILILVVAFFSVLLTTKYVSLASIISAILLPIAVFFTDKTDNIYLFILSLLIGIFVVYRHKTNISRLLNGSENKFSF